MPERQSQVRASEWKQNSGITWRALEPFGVEVSGDLGADLSSESADCLISLFNKYGLIVAKNQSLSRHQQQTLVRLIGPTMEREGENGFVTSEGGENMASAGLPFHADGAYTAYPFAAISLHATDLVEGASSTRFVHAAQALDTLPEDLRHLLNSHEVEMISPHVDTLELRSCDVREHSPLYAEIRPAILVNSRTGRLAIGVSEMHAARIVGLPWEKSREILDGVFNHLYRPDRIYEHVWHIGDVVFWDNMALQHARGSLRKAGRRVFQRVISGDQDRGPKALALMIKNAPS